MEDILKWTPPEVLEKYYCMGSSGYDKLGCVGKFPAFSQLEIGIDSCRHHLRIINFSSCHLSTAIIRGWKSNNWNHKRKLFTRYNSMLSTFQFGSAPTVKWMGWKGLWNPFPKRITCGTSSTVRREPKLCVSNATVLTAPSNHRRSSSWIWTNSTWINFKMVSDQALPSSSDDR